MTPYTLAKPRLPQFKRDQRVRLAGQVAGTPSEQHVLIRVGAGGLYTLRLAVDDPCIEVVRERTRGYEPATEVVS